ncbi:hypothetical protein QYF61_025569 [Mycteria americana]|uniref:Uncharacterized protein n=1 Tax=Mycteria americana TaxID=33587 RepID=A0AAN7N6Q1_MYCAM|nr:hypothetical protein QYF61_025569 [Mycteria americana]
MDYITLPQTRQGKCRVLTMVEATTGWLETYPVPHATTQNTVLGLENQVLWANAPAPTILGVSLTSLQFFNAFPVLGAQNRTPYLDKGGREQDRSRVVEFRGHVQGEKPSKGQLEAMRLAHRVLRLVDLLLPKDNLITSLHRFTW